MKMIYDEILEPGDELNPWNEEGILQVSPFEKLREGKEYQIRLT